MSHHGELGGPASTDESETRVAVVLSGAIARGPLQAGALGAVLTRLNGTLAQPSILIGTSAGAINAALWVKYSGDPSIGPSGIAEKVRSVWLSMPAEQTASLQDPKTLTGCSVNWDALMGQLQQAIINDGNKAGCVYYGLLPSGTPVGTPNFPGAPKGVIGCGVSGIGTGLNGDGETMADEIGHALV